MPTNEITRHRQTDEWLVRVDDKPYWAIRDSSDVYPEHWDVKAVRTAPQGGEYHQYLHDNSKVRATNSTSFGASQSNDNRIRSPQ